jgi:hypothetical protein
LWEIFLAPSFGKNFQPTQLQHTPLPVTRFNQRLELALGIAPVE